MTRRAALLAGGAGVAAAAAVSATEAGALPGRTWLHRWLGMLGPSGSLPHIRPGRLIEGSFLSRHRNGARTGWSVALPPGREPAGLPVVVALHGLDQDHSSVNGPHLGIPQFLAAAVADGVPPFAVAAVDGGTSYWHPHEGEDCGAMVLDEFLPLLAHQGLRTRRIGLLGWSMGGYGALRLAGILGRRRVTGVAVASPALWPDGSAGSPSGFDSAEEYATYSVMHDQSRLAGIPVRIDIGRDDPFLAATETYAAGFPDRADARLHVEPGAHEAAYWRRMVPAQLHFLGSTLAV